MYAIEERFQILQAIKIWNLVYPKTIFRQAVWSLKHVNVIYLQFAICS